MTRQNLAKLSILGILGIVLSQPAFSQQEPAAKVLRMVDPVPPGASAPQQFVGEIRMFAGHFAPQGWALCDGQLLAINQHQGLYSILGPTYGGDGRTSFALPDLRGGMPPFSGVNFIISLTGAYPSRSSASAASAVGLVHEEEIPRAGASLEDRGQSSTPSFSDGSVHNAPRTGSQTGADVAPQPLSGRPGRGTTGGVIADTVPLDSGTAPPRAVDSCLRFVREFVSNTRRKGVEIERRVVVNAERSCENDGAIDQARSILLGAPVQPEILSFSADPQTIDPGDWVSLYWEVKGAQKVLLFDDYGELDSRIELPGGEFGWPSSMDGEQQENLHESTKFTLVAINEAGRVTKSFQVIARAEAEVCAQESIRQCRRYGATCDVVHAVNGSASDVCRWAAKRSADACSSTVGIWTPASSEYARKHPDAVRPDTTGACITEASNVRRIVD